MCYYERYKALIHKLGVEYLDELNKYGYVLPGNNGPYMDPETPVRNTAHWLITFSYLYKETGDKIFLEGLEKCGEYLLSDEARPMQATFYCRKNPKKDFSNGLIGQAWVIEALVEAYSVLDNDKFINAANEVFLLHPFDDNLGLWVVVNVDGSYKGFDMTFNHQLWFAAAGALLHNLQQNQECRRQIDIFLKKIKHNFQVYNNGLIKHKIQRKHNKKEKLRWGYDLCKNWKNRLVSGRNMVYKENGYHLFNLYAFALIYYYIDSDNQFWESKKFKKALNYAFSDSLFTILEKDNHALDITFPAMDKKISVNRYGYPYNAPGFELPYIYNIFKDRFFKNNNNQCYEKTKFALKRQLALTYETNLNSFSINTEDQRTLNSRIYEITRAL
ncbi:hypothetical protein [Natranaerofaba carboxydovora]|uniref:hypothetical protein n=1 Tax=Natranaerofaba carboxydovora TaxID=2742683 RepID=UPI001F1363D1|nr:hypothetical protein [Natranaerofaba carboxydovora]UMZ74719.1 hypothetical protein ACONDI_02319 [Natranaerofaba carboxydovora]